MSVGQYCALKKVVNEYEIKVANKNWFRVGGHFLRTGVDLKGILSHLAASNRFYFLVQNVCGFKGIDSELISTACTM